MKSYFLFNLVFIFAEKRGLMGGITLKSNALSNSQFWYPISWKIFPETLQPASVRRRHFPLAVSLNSQKSFCTLKSDFSLELVTWEGIFTLPVTLVLLLTFAVVCCWVIKLKQVSYQTVLHNGSICRDKQPWHRDALSTAEGWIAGQ